MHGRVKQKLDPGDTEVKRAVLSEENARYHVIALSRWVRDAYSRYFVFATAYIIVDTWFGHTEIGSEYPVYYLKCSS